MGGGVDGGREGTGVGGEITGVGGGENVGEDGGKGKGGDGTGGANGAQWKELQRAGCCWNAAHCAGDRCAGRPGRQLTLSSNDGTLIHAGGSPVKKLYEKVKFCRRGSWQIEGGICPESRLCATSSCSRLRILPISFGSGPRSSLKLTSSTVSSLSSPISLGKQDLRPLFIRIISFRVFDILPMLAGRHPPKRLFASTITETGEFPMLFGISKRNRLLFMKMASRSLSKSSGGTVPSNSLNRRSRYLRDGRRSTTSGNFPAKRLLLTSSSKSRRRRSKRCGMVPQNLLELMWKSARSVRSPSSSGRYPAMSAWFRSIPATTITLRLKGSGAQKMPL